jgi:beta-N-acetylhexosaminidase
MSYRPLIIDLDGLELSAVEKDLLRHPKIGGVILFSRNYHDKNQLRYLIYSIKKLNADLFITVDHEGGRVQRFQNEFTKLLALEDLGKLYAQNLANIEVIKQHAKTLAKELHEVDVDFSLAPVLDVNWGLNTAIGNRSFSSNPTVVANLGAVYIDELHHNHMLAVAKHFPGHGSVRNDTHTASAVDMRDYATIANSDLLPFIEALKHNLDAIMVSHVIYATIDKLPTCFSAVWLQQILRQKLNFNGIIFSDDLSMYAARQYGNSGECAKLALDAGCDMVLLCNNRSGVYIALETLKNYDNLVAASRINKVLKTWRRS